jgi:hypothetical protein
MKTNATLGAVALLLHAMGMTACSDSGGGKGTDGGKSTGGGPSGNFTAAKPPSDVCGMLTLADVQAALPGAQDGVEQQTPDTSDLGFWSRDCKWETMSTSLELVIFGATTAGGLMGIKFAAQTGTTNTPVSGVGDEAHYWEQSDVGTNGLWALKAPYSVDTTAYFVKPFPTADQFKPLVVKALGQL